MKGMAALLLVALTISEGCAGHAYGPVPVEGVVTGKHQTTPSDNPSGNPGKKPPRYFLWVKTKDGPAFVEVSEEVFHTAAEGDQVCLNCDNDRP